MDTSDIRKNAGQLVWALALIVMGIALVFYIPHDPRFAEMGQSSAKTGYIKLCFYVIAFLLIGGGIRKIILHLRTAASAQAGKTSDNTEK